jgi:hypothetical protein
VVCFTCRKRICISKKDYAPKFNLTDDKIGFYCEAMVFMHEGMKEGAGLDQNGRAVQVLDDGSVFHDSSDIHLFSGLHL